MPCRQDLRCAPFYEAGSWRPSRRISILDFHRAGQDTTAPKRPGQFSQNRGSCSPHERLTRESGCWRNLSRKRGFAPSGGSLPLPCYLARPRRISRHRAAAAMAQGVRVPGPVRWARQSPHPQFLKCLPLGSYHVKWFQGVLILVQGPIQWLHADGPPGWYRALSRNVPPRPQGEAPFSQRRGAYSRRRRRAAERKSTAVTMR